MRHLTERHPVLTYLVLCFAISWTVWFGILLVESDQWVLIKILVSVGLGPGLAVVILDRVRGNAGGGDRNWWTRFSIVFLVVATLHLWSLLAGDAARTVEVAEAVPVGLSTLGVLGSLVSAAIAGLVFASVAGSHSRSLSSILSWRAPVRWWLVALFLPAALILLSHGIALVTGDQEPMLSRAGLSSMTWFSYVLRSVLLTLLVVTVGEEPGWRGWMLPELQQRFSPLTSSALVGFVWGLWHFPLFINGMYPGPADAVVEYLFLGPVLAILFTWIYNRTGGNLLLALVLHTAINNTSRVLSAAPTFPFLLIALVVTLIFTERMWRRRAA